jgi:hypothetical protein
MRHATPVFSITPWPFLLTFLATIASLGTAQEQSNDLSMSKALSFFAPFDGAPTATLARGEKTLFISDSVNNRATAREWSPSQSHIQLSNQEGRFSGCLRFERASDQVVFYKAQNNFPIPAENGSGTVSFWLKTDPDKELKEGFCDPIQITSKQWDDASFFVEFEKRASGVPFRLGIYADKNIWNPTGIDFAAIPVEKRPLASVDRPPFRRDQWIHVAFTFSNFNSSLPNATSTLYLNGARVGSISPRIQTFTWDAKHAAIMLGLNYIGCIDELAIFQRELKDHEIQTLYGLPNGVSDLIDKEIK